MRSETCFSTGKACVAGLVILIALVSVNVYKGWICQAPTASASDPIPDPIPDHIPDPIPEEGASEEVDPIQALNTKMGQQTQLLLDIHQDMDEVNSNLNEIQVLLREE